jgi:hypothetical protein
MSRGVNAKTKDPDYSDVLPLAQNAGMGLDHQPLEDCCSVRAAAASTRCWSTITACLATKDVLKALKGDSVCALRPPGAQSEQPALLKVRAKAFCSAGLEQQDGYLPEVKVDEVLCLVRDV